MSRLQGCASASLVCGLVIALGCLTPAAARSYTHRVAINCGAGLDMCVPACDYTVPGGLVLGKCYDSCSRGAGICEASLIPRPVSYRSHSRYQVRK